MKKRLVCVLLCILFALPTGVFAQSEDQPDYSTASDWALSDMEEACRIGILKPYLARNFDKPITREEFCCICRDVILCLYDCADYTELENVPYIKEKLDKSGFEGFLDCDSAAADFCAGLGIISGMGDGTFRPDDPITRQQAAVMLCKSLELLYADLSKDRDKGRELPDGLFYPHVFSDGGDISSWARDSVFAVYHTGIMMGNADNSFAPDGTYTKEQSTATFLRLYHLWEKDNICANPEYYPYGEYGKKMLNDHGIDMSYQWQEKYAEFEPQYIDNYGNIHGADELGYVYPIGEKYMTVLTSVGAGVGRETVIDKNKDDILSGSSISMVEHINGDLAEVTETGSGTELYDLTTGKPVSNEIFGIIKTNDRNVYPVGEGMYMVEVPSDPDHCYFMNSRLEKISESIYRYDSNRFLNGLVAARRSDDGSFDVLDTTGKILQNVKAKIDNLSGGGRIFGTNMIYTLSSGMEEELLRLVSGERIRMGGFFMFFENGDIYAEGAADEKGERIMYVLDNMGKPRFSTADKGCASFGYKNGFYVGDRSDESCFLMDKNGNVIIDGLNAVTIFTEMLTDGGGIYACSNMDGEFVTFNRKGEILGKIPVNKGLNPDYCDFINGLIRVGNDFNGKCEYYLPNGKKADIYKAAS